MNCKNCGGSDIIEIEPHPGWGDNWRYFFCYECRVMNFIPKLDNLISFTDFCELKAIEARNIIYILEQVYTTQW
jgi:hypothetical protein